MPGANLGSRKSWNWTTSGSAIASSNDWMNREQHCEIPFTRDRDIDAYSGFYFVRDSA
jgi:hypothetical protein